ncbi:MAG: O-antigen ligase family protein, partial [Verrucomicrobiales bacterium]
AAAGFDGAARSTRSWRTWVSWIPWAVGLAAIYLALVQNASRFGILLFFGGLLAWAGFVALYTKSITRLAMSAAGVLALLAAFFLFGGQAFEKFAFGDGFFDRIFADGRVRIYYDCLLAFKELPIFGYGLGNFEFAFNLGRVESLTSERALHPESDWLWVFIELGYAAVFLLPAGIFMVLARFTPLGGGSGDSEREKARRRGRRVRLAAVAGAGAFVLHSLFDVPGHVWGSVLPALVLGAIAAHPFDHRPIAASWSAWLFRAGGTFAVMLGMLWGAGAFFGVVPPGAVGAVFLVAKAREAADDPNQTPEAAADAAVFISRAIELEPMRWDHYFFRGSLFAQIGARGQDQSRRGDFLRAARDDFRRARYLEPLSPRVPEAEANVWLSVEPRYAIAAWREVLRRDSLRAHEYYGRMVHAAREHPELRDGIRSLSFMYPKLRLAYLSIANDDEFGAEMQEILDADPELKLFNADQKAAFFQHWARRGDKIALLEQLYENEEWMNAGWRIPAAEHAARGEYEEAYILALRHVERPTMPGLKLNKSVKQLRQEFYNHPTDLSRGISLFFAQDKQGLREEAVQTLDKVSKLEGAPGYIVFLQAEAWAKLEDYKTAYEKLLEADRIAPRLRAEK